MTDLKQLLEMGGHIISSEETRKLLCGEYSDGTPRCLADAINGETLSPKQKKKLLNKKRSKKNKEMIPYESKKREYDKLMDKKKKKKHKNKKKKKTNNLGVDVIFF